MDLCLTGLSLAQLVELLEALGQPPFRARQLFSWIHRSSAQDFFQMTNLPRQLQAQLASGYKLGATEIITEFTSQDGGTIKLLLGLHDGETVESVLMSYGGRRTVCLSTQVGCPLGCPFCSTGQSGFKRNLSTAEIVDQALHFARLLGRRGERITHVVFMGMGEPLLNYQATWQSIRILNHPYGQALGARRLTISTAGWVPGIRRAAKEGLPVKLALSLHAPTDTLRERLVPLNQRYPLDQVVSACREYVEATGRRLTLEYALIDGLNDDPSLAGKLASLFQGVPIHVNLIALNPTPAFGRRASPHRRIDAFRRALDQFRVPHTLRLSRGLDIEAGCGQLRQRALQKP